MATSGGTPSAAEGTPLAEGTSPQSLPEGSNQQVSTEGTALRIAPSEIKKIIIRTPPETPEREGQPIEISPQTYETLLRTITFNIEIFNQIEENKRPAILREFVAVLKMQFPNLDLRNKEEVAKAADQFLREGGGRAVLGAFKLMEWEASILHLVSQARFEGIDPKARQSVGEEEIGVVFINPQTGQVTREKRKIDRRGWRERIRDLFCPEKDIWGEKQLIIGTTIINLQNQNLSPADRAYLEACGWRQNTDIGTEKNRQLLVERLLNIAQARAELFAKTGLPADEISERLNFLDKAGKLKTSGKKPHFKGEVEGGGYTPQQLATEAENIIKEIKESTSKKLQEKIRGEREKRRGEQLARRIEDLSKTEEMTPEEIEQERRALEEEIRRRGEDLALFRRRTVLEREIAEAEGEKNEVEALLQKVANDRGVETDNLLSWSSPSSSEYWGYLEREIESLKQKRTTLERDITDLRSEIQIERNGISSFGAINQRQITTKDGQTIVERPDDTVLQIIEASQDRIRQLQTTIDRKRDEISSLDAAIDEKERELQKRKRVEDDPEIREILAKYREAERLLAQKRDEQRKIEARIKALKQKEDGSEESDEEVQSRLRREIRKIKEELESVGKVSVENQRKIMALSLIRELYTNPEKKSAMEERLCQQELGIYEKLEFSPEFKDYPPVVLHAVRLMFGDEALFSIGETEIYKKAKALLEQYGNEIEEVIREGVARTQKGQTEKVEIRTLSMSVLNEEIVRQIIDKIIELGLDYSRPDGTQSSANSTDSPQANLDGTQVNPTTNDTEANPDGRQEGGQEDEQSPVNSSS